MGMAVAPFRQRRRNAALDLVAGAIDDDARQGECHPERHHQVGGVLGDEGTGVVVVAGSRLGEMRQQGEGDAGTDDHQPDEADEGRPTLYHKHIFVIDLAARAVKSCANFD
jgi:hypothetical protein